MTILSITPIVYIVIIFFIISITVTYGIVKQMRKTAPDNRPGALVIFIWATVFLLECASLSLIRDLLAVKDALRYEASVVDWTSEWKKTRKKKGRPSSTILMHTPILEFTTYEGEVLQRNASFSSSSLPVKGKKYTVYYNADIDYFTAAGTVTSNKCILGFWLTLLSVLFYALIRFAIIRKYVFRFFFPLLAFAFIIFDVAFIAILFTKSPSGTELIALRSLIFLLSLGAFVALKLLIKKKAVWLIDS